MAVDLEREDWSVADSAQISTRLHVGVMVISRLPKMAIYLFIQIEIPSDAC